MILKRDLLPGLILCFVIFSFIVPLLFGLTIIPRTVTGGEDVILISQKDQSSPLNTTLLEALDNSTNITLLSPEIIVPTIINGEPIVCRGVDRKDVLELDGVNLDGNWISMNTGILGEDAAKRMGVNIGDRLTVTSPNLPGFCLITLSGIYRSEDPADILLISNGYARFLIGLGEDDYTLIRLRSSNPLEVQKLVKQMGTGVTNIAVEAPTDESNGDGTNHSESAKLRLTRRFTDFFSLSDASGGYTSAAMRYGQQTIDATVMALGVMTALLVTVGVVVLILRGIAEGRKDMGVLVAIGAPKKRIRLFILGDLLFLVGIGAPMGTGIGLAASYLLSSVYPLTAFGQTIVPRASLPTVAFLLAGAVFIPLVAWVIGGEATIGEHPKTLFAPIEVSVPFTPLEEVIEGECEGKRERVEAKEEGVQMGGEKKEEGTRDEGEFRREWKQKREGVEKEEGGNEE
ncbi:MAG: FtsX-like permease family protein [Thermoplasmata archaeon]|nr:FtsX-like permease family protein [Thermoplasmata archaeon]